MALSTAPLARKSVMWLVRLKLPVSHVPAGTNSVVPPRRRWCWMWYTALRNAHVLSVRLSPTPPNWVMDTTSGRDLTGTAPAHVAAADTVPHCTNSTCSTASSTTTTSPCNAAMLLCSCNKIKWTGNCCNKQRPSRGLQEELFRCMIPKKGEQILGLCWEAEDG